MAEPGFHDALFPLPISLGARGGPERRTEIVRTASGGEVRRARWAQSLRRWRIASGTRRFEEAEELLAFFEAREGRRYAFRFCDPLDHSSAPGGAEPGPFDQPLGLGDGLSASFALVKSYVGAFRPVTLPRPQSLRVAVGGTELAPDSFAFDEEARSLLLDLPPSVGEAVTAGFLFDVPARFETDRLVLELGARGASVPALEIAEVRL